MGGGAESRLRRKNRNEEEYCSPSGDTIETRKLIARTSRGPPSRRHGCRAAWVSPARERSLHKFLPPKGPDPDGPQSPFFRYRRRSDDQRFERKQEHSWMEIRDKNRAHPPGPPPPLRQPTGLGAKTPPQGASGRLAGPFFDGALGSSGSAAHVPGRGAVSP